MSLRLDIGLASRPKPGELVCGDAVGITEHDGVHLIAVADGLGHGPEAALAARSAIECVAANAQSPLCDIMRACDAALAGGRGAALTILRIDAKTGEAWHVAVGNVELHTAMRLPARPLSVPGIVGARFRKVTETSLRLSAGDSIFVYSDGIASRFIEKPPSSGDAQRVADEMVRSFAKDHDDATCVVIRC